LLVWGDGVVGVVAVLLPHAATDKAKNGISTRDDKLMDGVLMSGREKEAFLEHLTTGGIIATRHTCVAAAADGLPIQHRSVSSPYIPDHMTQRVAPVGWTASIPTSNCIVGGAP
jgi:hypothetical protein